MKTANLVLVFVAVAFICSGFSQDSTDPVVAARMSVDKVPFGTARDGQAVDLYTLKNGNGITAKVMTYGAIIQSLEVPDKNGKPANVTLNRETLADYESRSACFGAVVGRYANRIAHGKFTLEGKEYVLARNAGPNHLHGGSRGFDKRVWSAEPIHGQDFVGVKLTYISKDGEENYPGTLTCTILYELNNQNEWKMDYSATTDKTTVINLSNHAYWNLAGAESGTVLNQLLMLDVEKYLVADETLIPTGEFGLVEGTPVDFRSPHAIGERMGQIKERQFGGGYDHCLVVKHLTSGDLSFCAKLKDPESGRTMEVFTTQPGVQIYSANFPSGAFEGPGGYKYPSHAGFCFETQHFPDSPNKPNFPSTILRPGKKYHEVTIHKFRVEK